MRQIMVASGAMSAFQAVADVTAAWDARCQLEIVRLAPGDRRMRWCKARVENQGSFE